MVRLGRGRIVFCQAAPWNFDYEKPTPNQLQSLAFLLSVLRNYYRIPSANVMGHRDVPGAKTDCPGKLFPVNSIRQSSYR